MILIPLGKGNFGSAATGLTLKSLHEEDLVNTSFHIACLIKETTTDSSIAESVEVFGANFCALMSGRSEDLAVIRN